MASPRVLILRAPGTNCDLETAFAFEQAGGMAEPVHIQQLLGSPKRCSEFQILCLPGGFSYGDDIAAGRILANQLRHYLNDTLQEFKQRGKLILGICNGFQSLIKSGILLPDMSTGTQATLTWSESGRYQDLWVDLAAVGSKCIFLNGVERMYLPIAHAEGKFVMSSDEVRKRLNNNGQLALRYWPGDLPVDPARSEPLPFPTNPNGSEFNVAGVCDETGCVFGLMPHPERHIDPTHHPRWTREPSRPHGDGFAVFQNAVGYFR